MEKTCLFHQKFERLKISSEIKGIFKLDVLEIALQLYSALRFERLKRIHLFKNQGQEQYIFETKCFPFQCPRYALE